MGRRRAVSGVLIALVLLAGWAVHRLGYATSQADRAEAATDEVAAEVARSLSRTRYDAHEAIQLARAATSGTGPGVEVLEAEGDRYDGTAELLIRVTTTGYYPGRTAYGENITDIRCYRIVQAGSQDFAGPVEKRCPAGADPLALPSPPGLPDGYDARLETWLRRLTAGGRADPAAVEEVALGALGNSGSARVTTARSGRTTGVAVFGGPFECVLAAADAEVDVWRPARASLGPGGTRCTAEAAARRAGAPR